MAEELSSDSDSWQEAPASAKKKKKTKVLSSDEDEDKEREGQSNSSSLALGSPFLPKGLMRLKQKLIPKAKNTIEHGSGMTPKRKRVLPRHQAQQEIKTKLMMMTSLKCSP